MRGFATPLGYSLVVASFALNQIHLATAACTNTSTFVVNAIDTTQFEGRASGGIRTQLDFISCPTSGNVSCTLPPKNYTITIAPQFNISTTPINTSRWDGVDSAMDASDILELPLNSSDRTAILEYMDGFWGRIPKSRWHLSPSPLTVTLNTANISHYVNLTVEPGYNMTLTYKSLRASNWVRYANCENETLDGNLIGALMPFYTTSGLIGALKPYDPKPGDEMMIAAALLVDKKFLNDSVPDTKGSGVDLKAGSGWATTLIALGVLAFNWL